MSRIDTLDSLCDHLRWAVSVELATIPPYLTAMFSMDEGSNAEAREVIRSVAMEEMLHLTLAANVLNAVRGDRPGPRLTGDAAPTYPGELPHSRGLQLALQPFSPAALDLFCAIERPARRPAPPQPDHFSSLGQFYAAIEDGLERLDDQIDWGMADPDAQIQPGAYYGGGGEIVVVHDLDTALAALTEITEQGEGVDGTIWDGDKLEFCERRELAHYFRFEELKLGRRYVDGDKPGTPSGPPILVDFDAVRPLNANPDTYVRAPIGLDDLLHACDDTYRHLLSTLETALNGQPHLLTAAVPAMYDLEYRARALMNVPVGNGRVASPLFRAG